MRVRSVRHCILVKTSLKKRQEERTESRAELREAVNSNPKTLQLCEQQLISFHTEMALIRK